MKGVTWLDLGQWPCGMAVIGDEASYTRFVKSYCGGVMDVEFPRRNAGHCMQLKNKTGDMMLVITVGRQSSREEMVTTVAHEATHAMRWVMEFVGEKVPGTETEAYLVEHIVRQTLRALAKKK